MTTPDLPGAVERLRTELDTRSFAPADVVPVLSYMTVGDLRTILEALDAKPADPLPAGAVEVGPTEYAEVIGARLPANIAPHAHLITWPQGDGAGKHRYFILPEVSE